MSGIITHYDNLKITRDAPEELIRASYKTLVKYYHPENFSGHENEALEIVETIRESYEVLIDPITRAKHDAWINEQETIAIQHSQWLFDMTLETALEANYQNRVNSQSTDLESENDPADSRENNKKSLLEDLKARFFNRSLNFALAGLILITLAFSVNDKNMTQHLSSLRGFSIEVLKPMIISEQGN